MARISVGACALLVPDAVERDVVATDHAGKVWAATEVPAVVSGPKGTLIELAYRRWEGEGQITTASRGDSGAAFDRLMSGARLGVRDRGDGTDACDIGLLRWDQSRGPQGWGNPSKATFEELDGVLGGPSGALLVECGAHDYGSRADVLLDSSTRRNWLTATFPASDPLGPLAVYVLTRVLPILASLGGEDAC